MAPTCGIEPHRITARLATPLSCTSLGKLVQWRTSKTYASLRASVEVREKPLKDARMVLLRRGNRRHDIRDLFDQARKVLLFGTKLRALGARFRQLIENALALVRKKPEINVFIGHGAMLLP